MRLTKLIPASALLLLCSSVSSQIPVINRSHYYDIGDSLLIFNKSDISLQDFGAGQSGPNVFWDFSEMDFTHPSVTTDTLIYISPESTPFFDDPDVNYNIANMCTVRKTDPFSSYNNDYTYMHLNDDSLSYIGHWADNGGNETWFDHCDNVIKELNFPLTYLDHYTDLYERFFLDVSGSDDHHITGSLEVIADGYGSLMTPDGDIIDNTVRIHNILSVRDSSLMFGVINKTIHSYRWYSSEQKGWILNMTMSTLNPLVPETAEYARLQESPTSVAGIENDQRFFECYPNPGNGTFRISHCDLIDHLSICDAVGHEIYSVDKPSVHSIPQISSPGVYVIRIDSGHKTTTQRLVVGS